MSDDFNYRINFDGDEGDARTEGDRMGDFFAKAFAQAFADVGPKLAAQFAKQFKNSTKNLFDSAADQSARFASAAAKHTASLREDLKALEARGEATRKTLNTIGADPNLLAVFDRNIAIAQSNLRDFQNALDRGDASPEMFTQLEASLKAVNQTAFRELGAFQSTVKSLTSAQAKAAEAGRQATQQAETRRNLESRQNHGKFIAAYQREGAEVLADARTTGRLMVNQERAAQRQRLETIKFAFDQIKRIEKSVSAIFRGSASVISGAFARVEGTVFRIGSVFRKSNRDINDGLRPALLAREGALSRSFHRQTSDVSTELHKQSVIIERFQKQAGTGVAGALSGRSGLGSALGLGAGIGGGFALFQGLKNGLSVGGDFVQGLAVLQAQLKLTDEQMQAVRAQSIELGNDISLPGVSALDAAQAIQILSKQFASLGERALPSAQAAARGVLQLSRATGVGAEEAARVIGAAVNVFGISADKAVEVADQVTNALTNAAGVGFSDFADAFQQSAAVFAQFQVPAVGAQEALTELNTALAVLARSGNVGSDAGTSLKQFFLATVRGSKPAQKALAEVTDRAGELGTVFFDEAGKTRPLADALDILRRGLKGMSDQARNTNLNAIFGTDAIRTANALLNVSSEEFARLTEAMGEQGTAASIAAAQNVGLRGALDALKSVIETQQIKTYEKFQGVLGKVVLAFADLLNKFFEGVGIFGVIRAGLAGLAAALGALLVVKTVAEGFQFFALALGALTTPIGLLVGSFAAIGAAVGVLAKVSPEFRAELKKLGGDLRSVFGSGASSIADRFASLSRFVRTEVIPAFVDFSIALIRRVKPAIEGIGGFIDSKILPVLKRFASTIKDLVIPAIGALREIWSIFVHDDFTGVGPWEEDSPIVAALFKFRDTVAGVVGDVRNLFTHIFDSLPTLTPARLLSTAGLAGLGTVIAGPIGAAIGAAVGLGLGAVNFAGLARKLLDAVLPQLAAFVKGIGDVLLGANVQRFLVGPFQKAAAALGFFLGNLITDPRLVKAIEKLLGLAALTGANFAKGFIGGATSNLPKLLDDFFNQLGALFIAGLKQVAINPLTVAKIFAAIFTARVVLNAFRGAGGTGAGSFTSGFIGGIRTRQRETSDALLGLFGGTQGQARLSARVRSQVVGVFQSINRDIQRLGGKSINIINVAQVDRAKIAEANARLADLRSGIGDVGAQAIISRARINEAFSGAGQASGGFFRILRGQINEGVADVKVGAGKMRLALKDAFTDASAGLGGTARAIGTTLGTGLVAGVGAALAGQQLGNATGAGGKAIGLAGIVSAALLPLITLPTVVGAPLAGVTLAVGALTAVIAAHGRASKKAAEETLEYRDALSGVETAADFLTAATKTVLDNIKAESPAVQGLLNDLGFNARDFADQVIKGSFDAADAIALIGPAFGSAGTDISKQLQQLAADGIGPQEALQKVADGAIRGNDGLEKLYESLRNVPDGFDIRNIIDLLDLLGDESGELGAGLPAALDIRELTARAAAQLETVRKSVVGLGSDVDAFNKRRLRIEFQDLATQQRGLEHLAGTMNAVGQSIDSLNEKHTTYINGQIQAVTSQLQAARDASAQALENILALVGGDLFDGFQKALDEALLSAADVGSQLGAALAGDETNPPIDIGELLKTGIESTANSAQLRGILEPFIQNIQGVLAKGFSDGLTLDQIAEQLGPIKTEIGKLEIPQSAKDAMLGLLNDFLSSDAVKAQVNQMEISDQAAADLTQQLDALNAALKVKIEFDPFQVRAELQKLTDLGLFSGALPSLGEIAAAQAAAAAANAPGAPVVSSADAAERAAAGGVTVSAINIYGATQPVPTASEVTMALTAAASAGKFVAPAVPIGSGNPFGTQPSPTTRFSAR